MYQTGTFILRFSSREDAKAALPVVKALVSHADDWNKRTMVCSNEITVGEDCFIANDTYRGLIFNICKTLAETNTWEFICYAEHLSDHGEIHEYIRFRNKTFQSHVKEERYATGAVTETACSGFVQDSCLILEDSDLTEFDTEEMRCSSCGEYYSYSASAPISRCPYCGDLAEHELAGQAIADAADLPGWKTYEFELPLGIDLPETPVSEGMDWISDCSENDTFGLNPVCFRSKNQYDAALMLCEVCGGWYRFESSAKQAERAELLRAVLSAGPGEPMWYYDVWHNSFDWVAALRDANPRYYGHFSDIDSIWELFGRLQQRSCLEKAECFAWFVSFFGDALRYDDRQQLSDCYVQCYDNHLETILYLCPEQISILTNGPTAVTANAGRYLARAAAGLIRMGHREDGLRLYQTLFDRVWTEKSSADEKKAVVDEFIGRLAAGYENEPYLDKDICTLLEKQCAKYSDAKWTTKVHLALGKNQITE